MKWRVSRKKEKKALLKSFVEMLISIKPVRFISLTGGVLTPPCPTPG